LEKKDGDETGTVRNDTPLGDIARSAASESRGATVRKNGAMSTGRRNTSLSKHLMALVMKGDVRRGDGSRVLRAPLEMAKGEKTAVDYVIEGRR